MAGVGSAPKNPSNRARRNADVIPLRVIRADPVQQPELPTLDVQVEQDGELVSQEFKWPPRTREWWQMWADSPLSNGFTQTDWDFLLDTALLHARYWMGNMGVAPELRLRVAKFGATPEDRARLRIQFATADEVEDRNDRRGDRKSAKERRGGLKANGE